MIGPTDFLLGGLAPLAAAAAAFALAWFATRRGAAAWPVGVVVGYAIGALALGARDSGLAAAASRWLHPADSYQWLTLIALAAVVPATVAALSGRRWLEWALAVPICLAAPARLLWSKYRASAQLRDAGFADDAITPGGAVAVLVGIAAATLAAWWLWRRAADASRLPKTRSLLAIVASTGAAAVAALTGALVFGQMFGVLAAALGGCAATAWLVGEKSGPESARGPVLLLFGGLLAAGATYSELQPWQAAALAAAVALPIGWLPRIDRLRPAAEAGVRIALCLLPLTGAVWHAAAEFAAINAPQPQESDEGDVYDYYQNLPANPPTSPQSSP